MRSWSFLFFALRVAAEVTAQDQRRIELRITGAANDTVLLANYFGNRLYYNDTAVANAAGDVVFARKSGYDPGLYAILLRGKRLTLVVNEEVVRLHTDAQDLEGKLTVVQSRENELLRERKRLQQGTNAPAALSTLASHGEGSLVAMMIRMAAVPERVAVHRADGSMDSSSTAFLYRHHYWDGLDLSDPRILHIPEFQDRFDEFIAVVVPNMSDSIERYTEQLVQRAGANKEVIRFIVTKVIDKYESMSDQGMDALYVHLVQKYVCASGVPDSAWTPAEKWQKACANAGSKASLIVGAVAQQLILCDTTEQRWVDLHKMPEEIIVLVFWSPHCGHCKQALPVLYEKYTKEWRAMGVGVYAVADAGDSALFTDWRSFIRAQHLDWVNVGLPQHVYAQAIMDPASLVPQYTTNESLRYKESWGISSTPRYFVLDAKRRIIGKPKTINEIIAMIKAQRNGEHR